ncbi:MAG: glutamate synthase small subunit [Verrucomicrobiota bacterium]
MGKPTGFLEFKRELPADRAEMERVKDWKEFHSHMPEADLRKQGARCMDCGIPFCHTGTLISGMAAGCPIHNLIPEWNDLVYRGLWKEALDRLHKTNNFPDFTGRVCPAPCEGSCVLGINAPPVTIKNIECSIIDHAWEQGWVVPEPPKTRTGKKVAVVGSGPAGLCAAAQLNKAGHLVTVFERADRPGGLLMYGIPNMKLDKELVVLRRIKQLEAEGVKFVCNTDVGTTLPAEQVMKDFDAVVLCTGATVPRDLPIDGRKLKGIHFAMEFLTANTRALLNQKRNGEFISAEGKDVVVIGGGDTGTDCVGTSIRHGCRSLVQVEILPKPPLERAKDNPWPEWPKVYKMDYGQEEAAKKFGADPRVYLTTATKFEDDGRGQVKAVHTVEVRWERNEKGQFIPKNVPGTEKVLPAQLVLLAMGFLGPEQKLLDALKLDRDARSNVKADFEKYHTNIKGVFAAGDCRRGQSLVVWAFNEGRGVARECDRYLMGRTDLP